MTVYNICFSSDDNYVEQVGVAIASILKNSGKEENFKFYILDGGISELSKDNLKKLKQIKDFEISYLSVNLKDFKNCPLLKDFSDEHKNYHVTLPTYFRFKLPSLLPDVDKILYLDGDLVVIGSLGELYNTELSDAYVAMALDSGNENEAERLGLTTYCNAGVMLINLKSWRDNQVEAKLFDYIKNNKDKIVWQDQDVLNVVLNDKIKILQRKWNFQFFLYDFSRYEKPHYDYRILHYAGQFKPWNFRIIHPLFQEYYDYLKLTPWSDKLSEYKKTAFERFFSELYRGSDFYNSVMEDSRKYIEQYANLKIEERNSDIKTLYKFLEDTKKEFIIPEISKLYKTIDENKNEFVIPEFSKVYKTIEDIKNDYVNPEFSKVYKTIDDIKNDYVIPEFSKVYKTIDDIKNDYVIPEFSKVYDLIDETKKEIIFPEISKLYKYLEEMKNEFTYSFDEKICTKEANLYKEIEKAYKYSEDITTQKFVESFQNTHNVENNLKTQIIEYRDWLGNHLREELSKQAEYNESVLQRMMQAVQNEQMDYLDKKIQEQNPLKDSDIDSKFNDIVTQLTSRIEEGLESIKVELERKQKEAIDSLIMNLGEK